jgi:hypothetical protein
MTTKQAVTMVSRVLTLYFLTLAAYRIIDLPLTLMSCQHYRMSDLASGSSYAYRVEVENLARSVLTIALDLFVALTFFRCGPGISRFLLNEPKALEQGDPAA